MNRLIVCVIKYRKTVKTQFPKAQSDVIKLLVLSEQHSKPKQI